MLGSVGLLGSVAIAIEPALSQGAIDLAPIPTDAQPVADPAPVAPAPAPAPAPSAPQAAPPAQNWDAHLPPVPADPPAPTASQPSTPSDRQAYIDPTNYNLGATPAYEEPTSVVLSERSTGCETTIGRGQGVPSSVCGATPQPPSPSRSQYATRPNRAPAPAASGQAPAPSYAAPARGIQPVGVGPVQVGSRGMRVRKPQPANPAYYTNADAVALRDRSIRPQGRPGNGNTSMLFPLSVPAPITSVFGLRVHPIFGDRRFHSGTDLGAPMGTPVVAAYAGQVAIADFLGGYGLTVVMQHNEGTEETLYAHLSELFVEPGEWVEQGTAIGRVGSTGNSTGPHLHFEVRQLTQEGWVARDPGAQLEYALAQLVNNLQTADAEPEADTEAPAEAS